MNNDVIIATNKSYKDDKHLEITHKSYNKEDTKVSSGVIHKMYNKNKRQIYVWEENKEFYDSLPNKSKIINMLIKEYRSNNGKAINQGPVTKNT